MALRPALSVQRRNIPVGLTAWRACAAAMHSLPLKRATIRLKAAIAKQITPTRPRPLGKLEASNIAGPGKRDWHGGLALGSGASMLALRSGHYFDFGLYR
jgi:hypothetical protein